MGLHQNHAFHPAHPCKPRQKSCIAPSRVEESIPMPIHTESRPRNMRGAVRADSARHSPRPHRTMTDQHKAALAAGRAQGRAVKAYLDALRKNKPSRGRKRTPDSIKARLAKIAEMLPEADALQEVLLIQEQSDLEIELKQLESDDGFEELEAAFILHGLAYSSSKGIEYGIWRKAGVPADVLAKAGIKR